MLTDDWIAFHFGDGDWLGAGSYGEAWKVPFEGHWATVKFTFSDAEAFCVERIKQIQSAAPEYDPLFPFPYVFAGGPIDGLQYDYDWYEKKGDDYWSPLDAPNYVYIREYAEPLPKKVLASEEEYSQAQELYRHAYEIQRKYGLYLMDMHVENWGLVKRGDFEVIVPLDLACGDEQNWWEEGFQDDPKPFDYPDWWKKDNVNGV